MALPPLATVTDLQSRFPRTLTADEGSRAGFLLGDASTLVRNYTGQQFTRVTNDTVTLRLNRGRITLPQRPADKPTAIAYADGVGTIPTAAWWWGGLDTVDFMPPPWLGNGPAFTHLRRPTTVTVTYSHGYTELPQDVVSIVCSMVGRVISAGAVMPGLSSGGLDDFRFQMGGSLTTGALVLTEEEKTETNQYRPKTGPRSFRGPPPPTTRVGSRSPNSPSKTPFRFSVKVLPADRTRRPAGCPEPR